MRWSSLASTSMIAERLSLSVSTCRRSSRLSDVHSSPLTTARWSAITSCESDAATGSSARPASVRIRTVAASCPANGSNHVGSARARDRVVPERHRQEPQRAPPGECDHRELDDRQREVHPDVEHVPPAVLVGELGAKDRDDAAAERPIRMGDEARPGCPGSLASVPAGPPAGRPRWSSPGTRCRCRRGSWPALSTRSRTGPGTRRSR